MADHSAKWREQIAWASDHFLPVFGELPLDRVGRHQIQAFLLSKGREERTVVTTSTRGKPIVRRYPPLSRSSLGHLRKVLHAVFETASADDLVLKNPVAHVQLPPQRVRRETATYDLVEIAKLLEASRDTTWHRPIFLCALLGLRRGEALGVRREDLFDGALHVQRDVEDGPDGPRTGPLKTLSSDRWLPLPDDMAREIASWEESGHLVTWRGCLIRPNGFTHALPKTAAKAGVPVLTVHALRASFNSALADLGCPLEWRREMMGHSQRGVTERHYTKYREEIAREWLGKLWTAFEAVRPDRAST